MFIKDLLKQKRVEKMLTQEALGELIGVDKAQISAWEKGTRNPGVLKLQKLAAALDIQPDQLFGNNSIGLEKTTSHVSEPELKYLSKGVKPDNSNPQLIPLYSLNVEAGFDTGLEGSPDYIEGYIQMPGIGKNEGSWIVSGHSMYPTISKGSRVVLRKVENWELLEWNNIYVIDINEMGPKVKRIKKGASKDSYLLVSDNKEYEPMEILKKEIKGIHRVLLAFEMF